MDTSFDNCSNCGHTDVPMATDKLCWVCYNQIYENRNATLDNVVKHFEDWLQEDDKLFKKISKKIFMQMFVQYCKDNGIDVTKLEQLLKDENNDMDDG